MSNRIRGACNVIIPDRLLQRGQLLTWTREAKQNLFQELGVTAVVNFWPKTDVELGELPLHWYWQISCPRSEDLLEDHIDDAVLSVVDYIRKKQRTVLVLCEAGVTRSVFFCVRVYAVYHDIKPSEALKRVSKGLGTVKLKPFMNQWIADRS